MLRSACIQHKQGETFNTFLEQVATKYEDDKLRADLWKRVLDAEITLISKTDLPSIDLTQHAADEWLKKHTLDPQVCHVVVAATLCHQNCGQVVFQLCALIKRTCHSDSSCVLTGSGTSGCPCG